MFYDLVGKTLNQYKLVEVIGTSELATVYKAFQPSLERWVAVKVLHTSDKAMTARFKREGKVVARLRHRNILIVHEYNEVDGFPFIAMEYIEGGTLSDLLDGNPKDWTDVIALIIPVGEALHYAHQHGLVHRDVKPSNILMAQEDWPLLADFGLVKMQESVDAITDTGEIMGTPGYIPPEQATGQEATAQSDIYSLGVIMFEMITGRLPFDHQSYNQMLLFHIMDDAPPPTQFNPDCPPALEQIIMKAMERRPEDRYANMHEMVAALNMFATSAGVPHLATSLRTRRLADVPTTELKSNVPPSSTINLNRGSDVQLLFTKQNVTLDLPMPHPEENDLIIGRAHGDSRVEVDLTPFDGFDAGVSRRHARLIKDGDQWLIEDLGSLNGTFVNDSQLTPNEPMPLKSNDLIRCSVLAFIFLNTPNL